MEFPKEEYLSVIGSNWLYPIVKLFEELNKYKLGKKKDVQASIIENGYSVAIIVSTVLMVESYLNRMSSIINCGNKNRCKIETRKIFRKQFGDSRTAIKLDELFVIRDTISHNHIWEANISWNDDGELEFIDRPKLKGDELFGNNLYRAVIDKENLTTRLLRLNLFPTRIGKDDAIKVIITSFEVLSFVEQENQKYCYISHLPVNYNNKAMTLSDFISKLDGANNNGLHKSDDDIAERVP